MSAPQEFEVPLPSGSKDPKVGSTSVLRVAGGASVPLMVFYVLWANWSGALEKSMADSMKQSVEASAAAQKTAEENRDTIRDMGYEVKSLTDELARLAQDMRAATDDRIKRSEVNGWIREFRASNRDNGVVIPLPIE